MIHIFIAWVAVPGANAHADNVNVKETVERALGVIQQATSFALNGVYRLNRPCLHACDTTSCKGRLSVVPNCDIHKN